ncbi:MAG TPA: hypothetical protein VFT49_00235 [Candidatus Saccharimonadales bacterium]|nr:hypothetical protein [Candidatus Saccharimonadales bacterium]
MYIANLKVPKDPRAARILTQAGLVAVFLYAGISQLQKPYDWTYYVPSFIHSLSLTTLVKVLAVYELVLVVWLLSGKYLKLAGLLCALTFGGIIAVNLHQLITTFRDIGLLFMALALILLAD